MKTKNQLALLPQDSRNFILQLCDQNPYTEVVRILAQPPPTGLSLLTSTSALCRFYRSFHPDLQKLSRITQFAASLQISRQGKPGAALTGILALLESHLLAALRQGQPVTELLPEIRALKAIHSAWSTDLRLRKECQALFSAEYQQHLHHLQNSSPADCLPLQDSPQDPLATTAPSSSDSTLSPLAASLPSLEPSLATPPETPPAAPSEIFREIPPIPLLSTPENQSLTGSPPAPSPLQSAIRSFLDAIDSRQPCRLPDIMPIPPALLPHLAA